jgi:glucosamine--fructose-6-phosphate aminotransferase (isomerizing)
MATKRTAKKIAGNKKRAENIPASKKDAARMFPHLMLKEIHEQPQAIRDTVSKHVNGEVIFPTELDAIEGALAGFKKIIIAASGSSRHAGLAGEIMIEDLAGVSVDVEYSSEYCYRSTHADADPIVLVVTQSGETADTIAAQREALARGAKTIAISNVAGSTIAREASANLLTYATDEAAIPATKSFTAQLVILHLLALFLARKRGRITAEVLRARLARISELPELLENSLGAWNWQAAECARQFKKDRAFLYLGRGVHYAIAREGALKLKEISYAQAEGIPAGELKHGPNALVNEHLPVVVVATCDDADPDSVLRYERTLSVIEYVKAESGKVIAIANEGNREVERAATHTLFVPATTELLLPVLEVVPLQLFAYHMAVLNGCDPDRPRNLVKAVVTE